MPTATSRFATADAPELTDGLASFCDGFTSLKQRPQAPHLFLPRVEGAMPQVFVIALAKMREMTTANATADATDQQSGEPLDVHEKR
jgi:hypothetical protein